MKTRLAASLGAEEAAMLYAAFLQDLSASLGGPGAWRGVVVHDGAAPGPFLRGRFGASWAFRPQGEGDLGERLVRAFDASAARGAPAAAAAGSDAPALRRRDVEGAFAALERSDLAVAPSPDGGFSLLALGSSVPASTLLAPVRWSTPGALADLRASAASLGLAASILPEVPDVDVLADLVRLRADLDADPSLAPATARLLAQLLAASPGAARGAAPRGAPRRTGACGVRIGAR